MGLELELLGLVRLLGGCDSGVGPGGGRVLQAEGRAGEQAGWPGRERGPSRDSERLLGGGWAARRGECPPPPWRLDPSPGEQPSERGLATR